MIREPLENFLAALRHAELRISPAEAIDAHNAAAAVGFADRTVFRDALCATLAKSADEVARFEACFDRFFAREGGEALSEGGSAPVDPGEADARSSELAQLMQSGDPTALDMAIEAAARRANVAAIQNNFQRNMLVGRVMRELGLEDLDRDIRAQGGGDGSREFAGDGLGEMRERLRTRVQRHVDRERDLHAAGNARTLREQRLSEMGFAALSPRDMAVMQQLVRKVAKKLATRYARRRLHAKRGQLDVRRTVRRSMANGGVPIHLLWKRRVIDRPRIVAICDVSRSVATFAQFLLLFLYSLNEAVEHLDAFAFSDRLAQVGDLLDADHPEQAIEGVLERIGFRSTDYGQALDDFAEHHLDTVDRRTTVIILGDGRTNGTDPRLDVMRRIQDRAKAVIWLNTEVEAAWGTGDSEMDAYRRFCTVAVTCSSLKELERVIDDVLKRYR